MSFFHVIEIATGNTVLRTAYRWLANDTASLFNDDANALTHKVEVGT